MTLGVQHAERPPHIGYSHSLAGPSRVAAVSRRQQQRRQLVHPTPPSTAFFFHLDPMIAPFMFCNRFSACFSRDPLRMYCLSLIVSDYPAKLSHPALQQQQVLTSHMPPHTMLAAPIHRPRNLAPTPPGHAPAVGGGRVHCRPSTPHACLRMRHFQRALHMSS